MSWRYLETLGCGLAFHFCFPYSLSSFLWFDLLSSCSWTEPRILASGGQEACRLGLPRFTSVACSLSAHWSPYVTLVLSEPTWPRRGLRKSQWTTISDDRAPAGSHLLTLKPSALHGFYPSMSVGCVRGTLRAVLWWCFNKGTEWPNAFQHSEFTGSIFLGKGFLPLGQWRHGGTIAGLSRASDLMLKRQCIYVMATAFFT